MKDFRIIATNDRKDFEEKIRNNLNDGFKMINSNLTALLPLQYVNPLDLKSVKKEIIFYAYMEKE